jgi:polyvinyl alcohol dehydrogenase (cytochrome)
MSALAPRWSQDLPGCTATPAVVGGVLYVSDWSGAVHALTADTGAQVWRAQTSDAGIDASPLVMDGRVYLGDAGGDFFALDARTGSELWRVSLDEHEDAHVFGSAAGVDGLVVVGVASVELVQLKDDYSFRGSLVALDAATGAERWRVYMTEDDETSGAGVSVWSSPAVDVERGLVLIGTGQTYEPPASPRSDALVAVDYATGEVAWVRQFTEGDVYVILSPAPKGPDADVGAAPTLLRAGGRDAVAVGDKAGVFSVLDRDTGETIWAKQLTPGSYLGGVMTSAANADGVIYVNSNHFTEPLGIDSLDAPSAANQNMTFALRADDGEVLWQVVGPYPSVGGVAVAGGVVYVGSVDGTLRALSASDGADLWSDQPGSLRASGASVVDGSVYACHGYRFFTGSGPVQGGLVAYSLP